ncbi:MAG: hypothetical protein ACK56F_29125, partial [bacterium]
MPMAFICFQMSGNFLSSFPRRTKRVTRNTCGPVGNVSESRPQLACMYVNRHNGKHAQHEAWQVSM